MNLPLFDLLYDKLRATEERKPYVAKVSSLTRRGTAVLKTDNGRKLEIKSSKDWKVGQDIVVVPTAANPVGVPR